MTRWGTVGRAVRGWSLWGAAPRVVGFALVVDALAVAAVVVAVAAREPVRPGNGTALALLGAGVVTQIELVRRDERLLALRSAGRPYVDLKAVWSFAALLLLPVTLALGLTLGASAYWWVRSPERPVAHRWVFSAASVLLASVAAWAVLRGWPVPRDPVGRDFPGPAGLAVICLAAGVRWAVNHGLVTGVATLDRPATPWLRRLTGRHDTALGLGALALGGVLAVLSEVSFWFVPVLLVALVAMHRGAALPGLLLDVHRDPKTGLAAAPTWRETATRSLARAARRGRGAGVLMVDLDAFKAVNDRWGHPTGDRVLRAVADALVAEVGPGGTVGRFGGEEFVVVLDDADLAAATRVAERLRARTATVTVPLGPGDDAGDVRGLSASVGVAAFPETADDLEELLRAADAALAAAKAAGRDRVARAAPTTAR